jgi:hypothetical protein
LYCCLLLRRSKSDTQSHESKQSRLWTNTSIHSRRSSKRSPRHFRYESGVNGAFKQRALRLIRSTSYVSYWNLQKSLTWPESYQNITASAKLDSSLYRILSRSLSSIKASLLTSPRDCGKSRIPKMGDIGSSYLKFRYVMERARQEHS